MFSIGRMKSIAISSGLLLAVLAPPLWANEPDHGDALKKDKGLVACWNCDAPHNDLVQNCAGGGLQGTNHGARWLDGALEFDGNSDYVSIRPPQRNLAALSTGTLSVWFKAHSARFGDCVQPIFYFGDPDGGSDNSSLIIELGHFWPDRKTTALYFTIYGIPGQKPTFCFDSSFDLELDTWYHFVAVVGNGFNTGYLNGVELTGRNYNFGGPHDTVFFGDVVNPGTCLLGKGWFYTFPSACFFDGRIGEVRVYDRPLDAGQVRSLYEERRYDLDGGAAAMRSPAVSRAPAGNPAFLLENHPNPFNPATRIRFSVPERADVTVRVFDAGGRLTATLLSGTVEAGVREVEWDGTDVRGRQAGSGVYFCQLTAGGQSVTKKLVLGR